MAQSLGQLAYRLRHKNRIVTGFEELDACFGGGQDRGLAFPGAVEISGPPGTGKSAIAIHFVLSALRSGRKVIWASCDYRCIALNRLRAIEGYRSELEAQLRVVHLSSLDHAARLAPKHCVVVCDHYDSLVTLLPKRLRKRATEFLMHQIVRWAVTNTVICLATSVPRGEDDVRGGQRKLAPVLMHPVFRIFVRRFEMYKTDQHTTVLRGCWRFTVDSIGVVMKPALPETTIAESDFFEDFEEQQSETSSSEGSAGSQLAGLRSTGSNLLSSADAEAGSGIEIRQANAHPSSPPGLTYDGPTLGSIPSALDLESSQAHSDRTLAGLQDFDPLDEVLQPHDSEDPHGGKRSASLSGVLHGVSTGHQSKIVKIDLPHGDQDENGVIPNSQLEYADYPL